MDSQKLKEDNLSREESAVWPLETDERSWIWHLEVDIEETSFIASGIGVDRAEPDGNSLRNEC